MSAHYKRLTSLVGGDLKPGDVVVDVGSFENARGFRGFTVDRPVPQLPTKPGTVGRATVRGVRDVIIMRSTSGFWLSAESLLGESMHGVDSIEHASFVLGWEPSDG